MNTSSSANDGHTHAPITIIWRSARRRVSDSPAARLVAEDVRVRLGCVRSGCARSPGNRSNRGAPAGDFTVEVMRGKRRASVGRLGSERSYTMRAPPLQAQGRRAQGRSGPLWQRRTRRPGHAARGGGRAGRDAPRRIAARLLPPGWVIVEPDCTRRGRVRPPRGRFILFDRRDQGRKRAAHHDETHEHEIGRAVHPGGHEGGPCHDRRRRRVCEPRGAARPLCRRPCAAALGSQEQLARARGSAACGITPSDGIAHDLPRRASRALQRESAWPNALRAAKRREYTVPIGTPRSTAI